MKSLFRLCQWFAYGVWGLAVFGSSNHFENFLVVIFSVGWFIWFENSVTDGGFKL